MALDSKFNELSAKRCITRNGGVVKGRTIYHKKPGLKVLSAIDYLVNNHKHLWRMGEEEPDGRKKKKVS